MSYVHLSSRALRAYEHGERPLTRWRKSDILDACAAQGLDISQLESFDEKVLQQVFLEKTGWHHTGLKYNKTDFYKIVDTSVRNKKNLRRKCRRLSQMV